MPSPEEFQPPAQPYVLRVVATFLLRASEVGNPEETPVRLEAAINDIGGTNVQIAVGPTPETPLDLQLDQNVEEFIRASEVKYPHKIVGTLIQQGLNQVRDLFFLGAAGLRRTRVGPQNIEYIRAHLLAVGIPLELKVNPSPLDMALLCERLDQIPLQVIFPEMMEHSRRTNCVRLTVDHALRKSEIFNHIIRNMGIIDREVLHQRAVELDQQITDARALLEQGGGNAAG